jgi:hypothetical protein
MNRRALVGMILILAVIGIAGGFLLVKHGDGIGM